MKTRFLLLATALVGSLAIAPIARAADPLPSWNDTAPKQAVIAFVEKVTKEGSPDFVPPAERIAAFDNDGTLWAEQPALGGYQLMVGADIFRGRYRESWETAQPLTPDVPLPYRFELPTANHVFLPGHRIMVQIQSSWFPLYDRNPQTFVTNIFHARPEDFRKATQRVFHAPDRASYVELPRL